LGIGGGGAAAVFAHDGSGDMKGHEIRAEGTAEAIPESVRGCEEDREAGEADEEINDRKTAHPRAIEKIAGPQLIKKGQSGSRRHAPDPSSAAAPRG
jgi:hypothetical protein